jgi:glycosyltransferase involved in cell wall biosynthesis
VPYVSEIHHVEGYPRAATLRETLTRRLTTTYIRWVRNRAAAIRAVNRVEVPELLRRLGVREERILVVPSLYVELDVFRPLPEEPKRYDVLFVGRLVPNKGIMTILDAVARVRETEPDVRLGIVGDGPLRAAVDRRLAELDLREGTTVLDDVPSARDVAALYNQARMLVCASTAEGGPRVTVEAMACGVPVISTPVGVMPELIEDGRNGLLFRWDVDELAEKIRSLLRDDELRARLGEAGRLSVQKFEAGAAVERLAHAYQALVRSRPGT